MKTDLRNLNYRQLLVRLPVWTAALLTLSAAETARPPLANTCGAGALYEVGRMLQPGNPNLGALLELPAPPEGFSLAEMAELSGAYHLGLVAASRTDPGPIAVPSIAHVQPNHYVAVLARERAGYRMFDPANGQTQFVDARQFESRLSGAFLIPAQALTQGWKRLAPAESRGIYGSTTIPSYGSNANADENGDEDCPKNEFDNEMKCPTCDEEKCPPGNNTTDDAGCSGCPKSPSEEVGMAVWRVSEPNLNLWIMDTPLYYTTSHDDWVIFKLTYRQRNASLGGDFFAVDTNIFGVGPGWECNWLGYVSATNGNTKISLKVPGGGRRKFDVALESSSYDPATGTRVSSKPTGFQLTSKGAANDYTYAVSRTNGVTNYFLQQRTDAKGRIYSFGYRVEGSRVLLTNLVDADGLANSLGYNNAAFPYLVTDVTNVFGRKTSLQYDSTGRLTNIIDMLGANSFSSFQYDAQGLITNLTTPYGNTTFQAITNPVSGFDFAGDNVVNRALLITDPNNSKQLFVYRHLASQLNPTNITALLPDAPQAPDPTPFSNTFESAGHSYRNSFYWGRQQYAALTEAFRTNTFTLENFNRLTTNDYNLARVKHWLFRRDSDPAAVSHVAATIRSPSPDGTNPGQTIWYDYAGKGTNWVEGTNARPSIIARVLPDTTTQLISIERNNWQLPTQIVASYSTVGTNVYWRTNTLTYATNGYGTNIDLVEVREVRPDTNALVVAYGNYLGHLPRLITDALGQVTTVTYHPTNRQITGIAWPSGLVTTNLYFTSGTNANWLQETKDLDGGTVLNRYQFTYERGVVKTLTDPRNLQITLNWDALERVTNATFPNGSFTLGYTNLDLLTFTDRMGHTTRYYYDRIRRLSQTIDPLNRTNSFTYCDCGSPEWITDALGRTTSFTYDFNGRMAYATYPGGYSINKQYDRVGRLTNLTDNAGYSVTNRFSNQGLLVLSSNAFGQAFGAIYDLRGRLTNLVDANGVVTTNTYDALNRIKTRALVGAGTETFNYSARGLTNHVDALGTNTFYGYDAASRLITITNGNGETNLFQYDATGSLTNLIDGRAKPARWAYDEYGRVTNKVDALGTNVFAYGYDADDRGTTRTDAFSRATSFLYDAVGNLTNVVYPGLTNRYAYDALNRLTNMVDALGTTAFGYHINGLLAFEDGPWAHDTVSFDYNTARLRTGLTLLQPNASAWVQNYGYDSIRRLTSTLSPAGTFGYDYLPGVGAVTAASALLKKLSLPGGSYVTNSFDAVARLLSTVLKNSTQANLDSHSYLYNSVSERTKQTRLDGSFADYTYDGIGQLLTAKGKESGGTSRWNEQFSYGYDKGGNLHYRTNYDLVQTFTVNDANELTGVGRNAAMTVSGTTTEAATSVTVNSVGAVLYGDRTFARTNVVLVDGNNTFTAIGQDALGRKDTNTVTIKLPASVSLQYDAKGNLTNDGRRSFVYDDENQLTQVVVTNGVNNSTRSDFVYDGLFRRRIRREWSWVNGNWAQSAEVRYVYDGRVVIQERDANDLPAVTYTRGLDLSGSREGAGGIGGLLARTDHGSGQSAFYHADGNGNITALVNAQQLVVARYTYDPFGNTLSKSGPLADANLYRFSSKEYHEPSGLVYYLYRFYDPNLQRWLNRDPITELGFLLQQTGRQLFQGSKSDAPPVGVEDDDPDINQLLVGPGGLNAYGFNGNNAIIFVDYLGLAPFCVCVQADDDHAWISVTDLATGERHTYGRWKIGYPRNAPAKARSSGVNTDMELKRGFGASRCVTLQSFTPTINAGYDAYNNNCATYAWSEWKRASGENLDKSGISSGTFDYPSVLKDSILKKNGGKKEVGCCK